MEWNTSILMKKSYVHIKIILLVMVDPHIAKMYPMFLMIPMVLLLGRFTSIGPVMMYGCVKLIDLIKVVIFHFWLKKERWLRNLTGVAE